jgi:hypothetical protein
VLLESGRQAEPGLFQLLGRVFGGRVTPLVGPLAVLMPGGPRSAPDSSGHVATPSARSGRCSCCWIVCGRPGGTGEGLADGRGLVCPEDGGL